MNKRMINGKQNQLYTREGE